MNNAVKTGLHHWWPKGLSSFWTGDDDCVTRINPQGEELRSPPAQFGGITNGHAVNLDGPWSFSFESKFDAVDSRLPYLVEEINSLEAKSYSISSQIHDRLQAQSPTDHFLNEIGMTVASLILRSPSHRNKIAKTTEYYQGQFGFSEPKADKNLINMNLAHKLEAFSRNFHGGKYVIAFSDEAEFIYGDGFYTNMASENLTGHRKTVLPLTPTAAIIYSRPTQYFTYPKLMTLKLRREEVIRFNDLVQVYSKNQLFYRSQKPDLLEPFTRGEFLTFQYHKIEWLEEFLAAVHQYRLPSK